MLKFYKSEFVFPISEKKFKEIFIDLEWLDANDFEIPLKIITIAKALEIKGIKAFSKSEKYEGYQVFGIENNRITKYFLDTPDCAVVLLAIEE